MSVTDDGYALLDFGGGEKLERFGGATVVRPAPAAAGRRQLPEADWDDAALTFTRENGWQGSPPPGWRVNAGCGVTLALRPADSGGVGFFPEHGMAADAAMSRLAEGRQDGAGANGRTTAGALNLFAHTGQLTLRLAAGGVAVTHVDSASAAVKVARGNALLSGLEDKPVRWIVDDAAAFLRRAVRRAERYALVAADPPAYGRGGKGRGGKSGGDWKLERDLPELLALCGQVLTPGGVLCLTCHGAGWTTGRLKDTMREVCPGAEAEASELSLTTPDGRKLAAGVMILLRKGQ